MKKIYLLFIAIVLTQTVLSESFIVNNINYEITSVNPNTVQVIANEPRYSGKVVIPSTVGYNGHNYIVNKVGLHAFYYAYADTVIISENVTTLSTESFVGCSQLKILNLPSTLSIIEDRAISYCNVLDSINVNSSNNNFASLNGILYNKAMTELFKVPSSRLGTFNVPTGITKIKNYAFESCTSLDTIVISEGVSEIGISAFYSCGNLKSVQLPNSLTLLDNDLFHFCSSLKSIILPSGINRIGNNVFSNCSSLDSIVIPQNVKSIGSHVFSYCNNLMEVTLPNGLTSIGPYAFSGCSLLKEVTIPNSVLSIGAATFTNCINLTNITLPIGLTRIEYSMFNNCKSLTSINIPSSVNSIEHSAFFQCEKLITINLPESLQIINPYTFGYCIALQNISLPQNITSLKEGVFYYCSSLSSIEIPSKVISISDNSFTGCTSLVKVFSKNVTPPILGVSVFSSNPEVFVPSLSIDTYKSADGWKSLRIFADLVNNQQSHYSPQYNVFKIGNQLIVGNLTNGELIQVFSISGSLLFSGIVNDNKISVSLKTTGMVIFGYKNIRTKYLVK